MSNTDPNPDTFGQTDADIERQLAQELGDQNIEQLMENADPAASPADSATPTPTAQDPPSRRQLVRGRVSAIRGDDVFIDLRGSDAKNQGLVPLTQFERAPRVGSIMDFVVERLDESQGLVILSREGAVGRATWDELRRGSVVEARVISTNKGGLELEMVGGVRAFMPVSQIDLHYVEDTEPLVGQKLQAQVQEINHRSHKVVLSRRQFLESERQGKQAQLWKEIEVGQTRQGTVTGIADYGLFVDLGGVDGMVHVSDMSYSRVDQPGDVAKVGQTVQVKVLKIDREKQRIGLGMKQVEPDPWQGIADRLKAGDHVTARVVRTVDFGAFVEIEPGVEGLLPVSELSWKRVGKPSDVVNVGDVLRLVIQTLDPEKCRISLSLKQVGGDPWIGAERTYEKHSLVDATVLSITEFGAFVELTPGVEGLVHISELADHRVDRADDILTIGQKQPFRVLDVDEEKQRISLSLKAVANPPTDPSSTDSIAYDSRGSSRPIGKSKARKKPGKPLKGGIE